MSPFTIYMIMANIEEFGGSDSLFVLDKLYADFLLFFLFMVFFHLQVKKEFLEKPERELRDFYLNHSSFHTCAGRFYI